MYVRFDPAETVLRDIRHVPLDVDFTKKVRTFDVPPDPDRAHIDIDRFELELGSFRAPGTPIHPLGTVKPCGERWR